MLAPLRVMANIAQLLDERAEAFGIYEPQNGRPVDAWCHEEHFFDLCEVLRADVDSEDKRVLFQRLIVAFSSNPNQKYQTAIREYVLYISGRATDHEPHICICSQEELRELFYMENRITRGVLLIGSTCIKKFGLNLRHEIPHWNELALD